VVKYSDYFKLTHSVYKIFKSRNATVNIYKTATLWGFSLKKYRFLSFQLPTELLV